MQNSTPESGVSDEPFRGRTLLRGGVLVLAILLPQVLLLAPSLMGRRILLPLNVLSAAGSYLPDDRAWPRPSQQDIKLSDLVYVIEMNRRYAVAEVRSGRLPLWNPLSYCGYPFIAANQSAVFSPYRLLDYAWPSPGAIAWGVLLQRLIAGLGAYFFFRRAMDVGFSAGLLGGVAYPLTGFVILWTGFPLAAVLSWFPWLLLTTHAVVVKPGGLGFIGVAIVTALALFSGHAGMAAHLMIVASLYAAWVAWEHYRHTPKPVLRRALIAMTAWGSAVVAGVLLSAPQTLPTVEYLQTSHRISHRSAGAPEVAGAGWTGLAELVLPHVQGSMAPPGIHLGRTNPLESAPAGYAGLLLTLALAPLAWRSRSRRSAVAFWMVAAIVACIPVLGVPGLSLVFSETPLKLLRNERLTFLIGFALLTVGVIGLDTLRRRQSADTSHAFPNVFGLPMVGVLVVVIILAGFNLYRAFTPPAALEQRLAQAGAALERGMRPARPLDSAEGLNDVREWFRRSHFIAFTACVVAATVLVISRPRVAHTPRWLMPAAGGLAILELFVMAWGQSPDADPGMYYPPVPALQAIASRHEPGRILGASCLPPCLNFVNALPDVRGYDGADPARIVDLLELFRDPTSRDTIVPYAVTQWFSPALPSPIADMLNVRYLIGRGPVPESVTWERVCVGADYWVFRNPNALARAFVPRTVEVEPLEAERLKKLSRRDFDARRIAYLESREGVSIQLPASSFDGRADIRHDTPSRVCVDVEMRSREGGLLVLADRWDSGWRATVNGTPAAVLRANHALRAVQVPSGKSQVEFIYAPTSFRVGVWLALGTLVVIVAYTGWRLASDRKRRGKSNPEIPSPPSHVSASAC